MRPYGWPRAARSRCSRRSQEGEPQTMSSSDQQYPYPYDPQHQPARCPAAAGRTGQQPQAPQDWPDGRRQTALPRSRGGYDQGDADGQAPTWDTQYQPTIRRDPQPCAAGQAQAYDAAAARYGRSTRSSGRRSRSTRSPSSTQPYQEPRPQSPAVPSRSSRTGPPRSTAACLRRAPRRPTRCRPRPRPPPAPPPLRARRPPHSAGARRRLRLRPAHHHRQRPRSPTPSAARAEGRSPIIAPGMQPAALTAGARAAAGRSAPPIGEYALARPAGAPPGGDRGRLVPAERHVARPAGHRAGLRRRRSPPTSRCSRPAGSTRPPRSSAPSASGCCSPSSSSCAATPTPTSGCTA